jgi:tryptophan 2,3-dioxygenase
MKSIRGDHLPPAFKSLARVTRIQERLTPADYLGISGSLAPSRNSTSRYG